MEVTPADLVEQRAAAEGWTDGEREHVRLAVEHLRASGVTRLDLTGLGLSAYRVVQGENAGEREWMAQGMPSGDRPEEV